MARARQLLEQSRRVEEVNISTIQKNMQNLEGLLETVGKLTRPGGVLGKQIDAVVYCDQNPGLCEDFQKIHEALLKAASSFEDVKMEVEMEALMSRK